LTPENNIRRSEATGGRQTDAGCPALFIQNDADFDVDRIAEVASMAAASRQELTGFCGGLSLYAPFLGAGYVHGGVK
jgi:hypothetical protein